MTIERLQKAALLLFYRNPLHTVALNLLGHTMLEYLQQELMSEMFSNEKLFKILEPLETTSDAKLEGTYQMVHAPVTTSRYVDIADLGELTRIVEMLHTTVGGIISEGQVVANSLKVGVNPLHNDGGLDIFVLYMRRTDVC